MPSLGKLSCLALFFALFAFPAKAQIVNSGGGSSSTTLAGNQGAIYASPACPTPYVSGTCYPVLADAHWVIDGTAASGSGIVTAPDMNATGLDQYGRVRAIVGQICFGTSLFLNGTLDIAQGTISSVNSATSITCSTTSGSNRTATEVFVWGDDDTTALNTAYAAAVAAGAFLHGPAGAMMVQSKILQDAVAVLGHQQADGFIGENTVIIGTPNFSFTGVSNSVGAFWSHPNIGSQLPNVDVIKDVTFWCGGNVSFGSATTGSLLVVQRAVLINVTGWGCGNTSANLTGLNILGPTTVIAGMIDDFGSIECNVSGGTQNTTVVFTGTGYCVGGTTALQMSSATVDSYGTFYGPSSSNAIKLSNSASIFNSFADIINPETTVGIDNSGTSNLFGTQMYNTSVVLTFGMVYARAGSKNYFQGSTFSLPAGSVALGGAGVTGFHTDGGANVIVGGAANGTVCTSSSCTLTGNASITGTTFTAAKAVLSANWGTSNTVTLPLGQTTQVNFLITNGTAATGASPTITYTFPTPYFVAPNYCVATQIGGTNAVGTFTSGAPSTTSVVFTFSLTPTANSTENVIINCYGP